MNEEKAINEQDLNKVTGGAETDAGFEAAWAEYAATHCGGCGISYHDREQLCEYGKLNASKEYAVTGEVRCSARFVPRA